MTTSSDERNALDTQGDAATHAIVEQMGHRRFGARIREVTRFGATCMEATALMPGGREVVTYVFPSSLFAVTECTEEQARKANNFHTGLPELGSGASEPVNYELFDDDGDEEHPCEKCGAQPGEPCAPNCDGVEDAP